MALVDSALRTAPTPPPASLRRGGPRVGIPSSSWLRLGVYGAALAVAFGSLTSVLEGWGWWLAIVLTLAVPLLAIGIARTVSTRRWVPPLVGVLASIALLSVVFAPLPSLLGFVPTPDTVARWAELVAEGSESISRQFVPAVAREGIQFLLAVLALVSVAAVAPVLDRAPAVSAVPLLIILDIPVVVRPGIAEPGWYVAAAIAFFALLRIGRRRMPLPGVLATGAALLAASLLLPQVLPPPRPEATSGGGFGSGVNPLIDLGQDLRQDDPVPALSYTSNAAGGIYLRLATLDRFDGLTWQPDTAVDEDGDVRVLPAPEGLGSAVARTPYTVDIELEEIGGRWVPMPYPATGITGGAESWRYEPDGLAVRSEEVVSGAEYSVDFVVVEPLLEQVNTTEEPDVSSRYLALPFVPEIVRDTAREVAGEGTPYERALALQSFFTETDFEYSLDAPVENGYDGTGVGVIAEFLRERSGYCVHFASAMAVMARLEGIPSRIAVGFQPGSATRVDGRNVYTAQSDDLHAWPELFIAGVGWLRFEPTPGRGTIPDYAGEPAVDDPSTPIDESAPAPLPSTAPSTAPIDDEPVEEESSGPTGVVSRGEPALVGGLVALAVVLVLLSPAITRAVLRRRRLARVRSGRDAGAAWAEVRDTAVDHDWVAPESETPRQLADRLALVVGTGSVTPLRDGVETAAYDRPGRGTLTADDVLALTRAIAGSAALAVRLRATFLPPSLFARLGLERRRE